jgi:hypothetical protein
MANYPVDLREDCVKIIGLLITGYACFFNFRGSGVFWSAYKTSFFDRAPLGSRIMRQI